MHGGLLIFLWLCAVGLMQRLPMVGLGGVVVFLCLAAAHYAPQLALRLVRRVRFLLLAIVVLFAWFTPGTLIVVELAQFGPTYEGVVLAAEHAGRVLAVVLCVALLMRYLSPDRLVGGLYALLRPFEPLGVPAARIAVRTLLVLEYVDSRPEAGWKQWLSPQKVETHEPVQVPVEAFRGRDWAALAGGLLTVAVVMVVT